MELPEDRTPEELTSFESTVVLPEQAVTSSEKEQLLSEEEAVNLQLTGGLIVRECGLQQCIVNPFCNAFSMT